MTHHFKNAGLLSSVLALVLATASCAPGAPADTSKWKITTAPLSVTLLHVGNTNSYVAPHNLMLKFNGLETLASVGGWSTVAAAVQDIRLRDVNVLLLHSGDAVEGTIWSTKFDGMADSDAMNTLGFDAMVLGNHEFARGLQQAARLTNSVKFPVLAANLDVSAEPSLSGKVKPYAISVYDGQEIGIIGLITPDTEFISNPGKTIKFLPAEETAREYIAELNGQGINKIVVLSHLGYEADTRLAGSVAGIDIIVGGHSRILAGGPEFERIGLEPGAPYPVEMAGPAGDKVLIVYGWENNQLLGQIVLNFDEKGKIVSYKAQPVIPATSGFELEDANGWNHLCPCMAQYGEIMKVVDNDPGIKVYWNSPEMDQALRLYASRVEADLNAVVAVADDDIVRGASGGTGPIVANAFLWSASRINPEVKIAIIDSCDVRADFYKGDILANDVYMALPSQHNLVTVTVKGSMIKALLEDGVDLLLKVQAQPPYVYAAGLAMDVDASRKSGDRVVSLQVRGEDGAYGPVEPDAEYSLVTTDYIAKRSASLMTNGVSWMGPVADWLKERAMTNAKYTDLGIKDVDAMIDYLKIQESVRDLPGEKEVPSPGPSK